MKPNWPCTMIPIVFLLASCGGDSGDSTQPAPISTPSPTPTPTPAPSPTPTPSSPTYLSASDFSRDRSFSGIGLRIGVDRSNGTAVTDVRLDPEGTAIGFDFTASSRTYVARYNSDTITAVTQGVATEPPYDKFSGPNSSFSRSPFALAASATGVLIGSTYFGYVDWSDNNGTGAGDFGTRSATRRLLFGARTVMSDLPTSSVAAFMGQSTMTGPGGGSGGTASITVDYAARTIAGATVFSPASTGGTGSSGGPAPTPEPITFSGTLDPSTGRLTGVITHTASGATGKFEGALYGPHGVEIAMVFTMSAVDGTRYSGLIGGRN
ncbi:hypothetical protein C8J47_3689 [Sphingomonas sp. PP-F2F-G114-C0414]|nr:hypothetical protein C8J47_3689 [Sphingomonas sp. PP-F2F-G114-C0414]